MHRRRFLALLAAPAALAWLPACGDDADDAAAPDGAPRPDGSEPAHDEGAGDGEVAEARSDAERIAVAAGDAAPAALATERFGIELHRVLAARQPAGNVVTSPVSIGLALTMALAGARGATASELAAALHADDPAGIHRSANALIAELDARTRDDQALAIASSLWGQRGTSFDAAFLDLLAAEYGAGLQLVDYRADADGARRRINEWVDDRTQGRVPALLAPGTLSAEARLTLVNAIHMTARWAEEFTPARTSDRPFTTATGEVVDVPTMALQRVLPYATGDGWRAVELDYDGGELTMTVLLPEPGFLAEFEQIFLLTDAVPYVEPTLVDLAMPRFEIESTIQLREVLEQVGVATAFTDRADFTGITTDEPLRISDVVHQATITVDEEGTEAAAATAVVVEAGAAPIEDEPIPFVIDRPFLFAVRDRPTGAVLFLGRVGDPRG